MHGRVRHTLRSRVAVGLAAIALAGCHHGPDPDQPVSYDGTTLYVMGAEYPREVVRDLDYARGHLLVQPQQGKDRCVADMLRKLGLSHTAAAGLRGTRDVAVREGFELQWASALSRQECVQSVGTDDPSRNTRGTG